MADSVIRIKPFHFIHVLNNNTNVTRVEVGPQTFTRQEHEKLVLGPEPMVSVPPRNYCVIANPSERDEAGAPILDASQQIKLRHGDHEIRFEQEPFALLPGEKLVGSVRPLQVVNANCALRLRALRTFEQAVGDKEVIKRVAGDEWLFEGPATYTPMVEVEVKEPIQASIVHPNQALKLRARRETVDRMGAKRRAGEEWLVRAEGAYLPGVDEEVVERVSAYILTEKKALHVRAMKTFTDVFGKKRRAGEEWLVTLSDCDTFIPDVYEEVVGPVDITTLSTRQYCVVCNVVNPATGKPQWAKRELRVGETSFFVQPGETLKAGIQNVIVLNSEEALLLRAIERVTVGEETKNPGDRWMIHGPCDYIPPVEVEVIQRRKAISLDENEGIYVRDIKTGKVRTITGESYQLDANEELWEKDLPPAVEKLLNKDLDVVADRGTYDKSSISSSQSRDKARVVTFRAPHNSAVQIYDYKAKHARVVFGPDLIMLGPDEHFTLLSLSADKPKRPNVVKSLALLLGPDFMTDVITVETSDHARLQLKLSYNWHFDIDKNNAQDAARLFAVPDFVGDACKAMGSLIRGAVAAVPFDKFHKLSARVIRSAVFGVGEDGKIGDQYTFASNKLCITNIDIQAVEPVDQKTRDSLQKSVQLAIEITTKSQEAAARHEAERTEQEARGRLERQKIEDEAKAEANRKKLLSLQAESAAVESTGHAAAEARARAKAASIEGNASVKQARQRAEATQIEAKEELDQLKARQTAEVDYQKQMNTLELNKAKELAAIEAKKFATLVNAIGPETIKSIAQAGPEMQAKLLQGLGLSGFLITDGKSPINLFQTAQGMIAGPTQD